MKLCLFILPLAFTLSSLASSQAANDRVASGANGVPIDRDLEKAIAARAEAERNRDMQSFSRMTTDDFTLTNERGEVITKPERIERLKAGQRQAQSQSDEQIRVYDNAALRTRRLVLEGKPLRMLTVWVKQNGQWKVAATQITPEQTRQSQSDSEAMILQLHEEAAKALLEGNIEAIPKLWADNFVGIGPTGRPRTKAELIEGYRQRLLKLESSEAIEPPQIRMYNNDTALVMIHARSKGKSGDRDTSGEYRGLWVWAKTNGNWQIVSYQSALIPNQGGATQQTQQSEKPLSQTQPSAPPDSDAGPDAKAVLARTDELNQAFLHTDMATLDRIIADECLQITQNGTGTKAEWLAPHRSGVRRVESIGRPEWRRIRLYGDVAVVTSAEEWVVAVRGEQRKFPLFQTRTWVKRSGQWYLVLAQNTARQEPAPAPAGANNAGVPGQTSTTNDEATIRKIGILATGGRLIEGSPTLEAFKQGMRELGYVEGQNIILELRNTAAELISLNVDVIVAAGTTDAAIAKKSTSTIPIVYMGGDPVDNGLATSRERPGENITGITVSPDLQLKHLQLLRQIVPGLKRVAVVFDPTYLAVPGTLKQTETAARSLGLELRPIEVRDPKGLDRALSEVSRERVGAMMVLISPKLYREKEKIVEFAVKSQLPMTTPYRQYAEAGALISLGVDALYWSRRLATYVDKILKGAKAGDLAIEQSTKLDFVINLKTAKVLGLTIPQSIVERADQVIQ